VRVSVIIPLYNKAPQVRRALDSVAAQSFGDFELIVVDDGSTDEGARIVEEYADARLRLVRQRNAGPGAARNRGIAEARGELLAFLDADDEWMPGYLEESVRLLDECGPGVASATSGYVTMPSGKTSEQKWRARGLREGIQRFTPETPTSLAVFMLAYMSPCSTVSRAASVRRWGGFYERERCLYAEDAFLWLKLLLNEAVAFRLAPLVRFHTDASALSNNLPGARPVEPFLLHPEEIEAACPPHLRPLLERLLAARAFKTACVLGYWGDWRAADSLAGRFDALKGRWRLPYYVPSVVCRTPVGAVLGRAWRALSALRP
jgi:glycosyltransferase involved in cell wall biosynthesis